MGSHFKCKAGLRCVSMIELEFCRRSTFNTSILWNFQDFMGKTNFFGYLAVQSLGSVSHMAASRSS
jgi:hypothetical protein